MGNNHACPVLQSGTADAHDLLQGQRGLFLASEVTTRQMALSTNVRDRWASVGRRRWTPNHHTYARVHLLAFGGC